MACFLRYVGLIGDLKNLYVFILTFLVGTAQGGLIPASSLTAGETAFTTADGGVSLESSGPLTRSSDYLGISGGVNAGAIDDADGLVPADESLAIRFETGFFITGLSVRWTRGEVRISGFLEDPQGSVGSYDALSGTWSYYQNWTSSASVSYTFANAAASLGRELELSILDPAIPNPQMAPVWIGYSALSGGDAPVPVVIDGATLGQTMESFGASAYWSFDPTENWPVELKERAAGLLFSEAGGIGLSSFRFDFGGGDLDGSGSRIAGNQTAEPGKWRFPEAMKTSAAGSFDWTRREGQQWFLRRAKGYGLERLTLGSNSPPAWCTKNGRTFCDESVVTIGDTNLDPLKVADYATYLCDVIEHFRDEEGITFSEVSPVNEPEYAWNSGSQEGCRFYDLADIRNLVSSLHAEMTTRRLTDDTQILLADHGSIQEVNGSNAFQNLHGHPDLQGKLSPFVGYHSYWSDLEPSLSSSLRDDFRDDASAIGKGTMQTEFCPLRSYGNGRDLSIEPAWYVFKVIHKDLTRANSAAWSWWRALSPADYKDGLLYTDFSYVGEPDPEIFDSKLLWMMGNFSRFIRPGFTRLGVLAPDDLSGLMFSAWLSPDGREVVVVAGNASATPQSIDLTPVLSGEVKEWEPWLTDAGHSLEQGDLFSGSYELPPRSFVSFVGRISESEFRLRCVVTVDEAFPNEGDPVTLSAKATWEDGLVRIRPHGGGDALTLNGMDEWVMRPLDRESRGLLTDGRFEIGVASTGEFLCLGGDESMFERPLLLSSAAESWVLESDLEGRRRLRHEATGRVISDGAIAMRDRGLESMRVALEEVPVVATVDWSDGFGSGLSIVDTPISERWYQAKVRVGDESATGRLLLRPGESGTWFDGLPAELSVVKGEAVTLTPQRREHDGAIRFRLNPADRDKSLVAVGGNSTETALLDRAPNGGDDELWQWVDASTGAARPRFDSGDHGWLKNVATGRILRPEGGVGVSHTSVVQVLTSQSDTESVWRIESVELGRWRIVHVSSGNVLGVSGVTGLPVLWPDGPETNLRFYLDPVDLRPSERWWAGSLGETRSVTFSPERSGLVTVHELSAGLLVSQSVAVQVKLRYEDWAAQLFGNASAPEAQPEVDADSDGLRNLFEFVYGLDPLNGQVSERPIKFMTLESGATEISFRINPEAAGTWSLETSNDCKNWRVMGVNEYQSDSSQIRVTAGTRERGFYRLGYLEAE